jgi:hypothetical protein
MTEKQWWRSADPRPMVELVRGRAGERKLRLFACACCRAYPAVLADPDFLAAVETAERAADGAAAPGELGAREYVVTELIFDTRYAKSRPLPHGAAQPLVAATARDPVPHWQLRPTRAKALAGLARCVFGNPFRGVAADYSWLTSTVTALARGIYEERAFDRLPILADALQDAGCDSADILGHCRGGGPHVRGCWVVDLLLGKE